MRSGGVEKGVSGALRRWRCLFGISFWGGGGVVCKGDSLRKRKRIRFLLRKNVKGGASGHSLCQETEMNRVPFDLPWKSQRGSLLRREGRPRHPFLIRPVTGLREFGLLDLTHLYE